MNSNKISEIRHELNKNFVNGNIPEFKKNAAIYYKLTEGKGEGNINFEISNDGETFIVCNEYKNKIKLD